MDLRWQLYLSINKLRGIEITEELRNTHQINFGIAPFDQLTAFKSLADNVTTSVDYYRNFKNEYNLENYPVVNKSIIKENYDLFSNSEYNMNQLKKVSTSGSTGIPFEVRWNKEKVVRNNIDTIYFGRFVNYIPGRPLVFMRVWNELNKLSWSAKLIKNIHPIDIGKIDAKRKNSIISQLCKAPKGSVLLAYGSTYQELARMLENKVSEVSIKNVKGVWVMSEPIDAETKSKLKQTFNSPVYTRYSNSENGFIAHQVDESGSYLVNRASYIVEILHPDKDETVGDGEVGRVVVTDLYNFANPFIRYDTGDLAVKRQVPTQAGKIELLTNIIGRKLDSICVNNVWISPHSIDYAFRNIKGVNQFQLILKSDHSYLIKLNVNSNYSQMEGEQLIREKMANLLGNNLYIAIEYVAEIPLLSSNKRKIVINEISEPDCDKMI